MPVLTSLLDTDLYKFTMWQVFLHKFPANTAKYRFVCRNAHGVPLAKMEAQVNEQLDHLCSLRFSERELDYLASLRFIKPDFVEFLRIFQLNRKFIKVWTEGEQLRIEAEGPQIHVMPFEIYVLSIVNELFTQAEATSRAHQLEEGRTRLQKKIDFLRTELPSSPKAHDFNFFDFGGRRRFSKAWHSEVVTTLARELPDYFKGTSNVALAMQLGITPIGTMAHEYLQTFQAVGVQLRNFQKEALEAWVQEYRGDLGIALTDVVGMDAFLRDFDLFHCKLFDGVRHDSGDPVEWGHKALAHYEKHRINPNTKRLVFSDGLNVETAVNLYNIFADKIAVGFGIGTNLTNDVGRTPLNLVMKLVECNGHPTAKLSDSPGKTLCSDEVFLAYLRKVFD